MMTYSENYNGRRYRGLASIAEPSDDGQAIIARANELLSDFAMSEGGRRG